MFLVVDNLLNCQLTVSIVCDCVVLISVFSSGKNNKLTKYGLVFQLLQFRGT